MHKTITTLVALATLAISMVVPAVPAEAHRHGGGTSTAILGVVGGTALGLGVSALVNRGRDRAYPSYQAYPQAYPQVAPQAYYPQQGQPQVYYRQAEGYYDEGQGETYRPAAVRAPAVARPAPRPAPHGVRCLRWNGYEYAPSSC